MAKTEIYTEFTFFRGRVGLAAALRALGIGHGDHVAMQAYTCDAVPEAIVAVGAKPLYIDIDLDTLGMAAESLKARLSPEIRAVVVQHTFGVPADIESIRAMTEAAGIPLIEDCCHTLGTTIGGQTVGRFGIAAFYSWEWGKPIIAGTGGSLVMNDPSLKTRVAALYPAFREPPAVRQYRIALQRVAHSLLYRPAFYRQIRRLYHLAGALHLAESNYNPINPNAVPVDYALRMGKVQFERLVSELQNVDSDSAMRRHLAANYRAALGGKKVRMLPERARCDMILARFPVKVDDKPAALARAAERGVELSGWYETVVHPLRDRELALMSYEDGSCPSAEWAAKHVVSLPMNRRVKRRDIEKAGELFA